MNISGLIRTPQIIPSILCAMLLVQPALAAVPGDEHWDNQFGWHRLQWHFVWL